MLNNREGETMTKQAYTPGPWIMESCNHGHLHTDCNVVLDAEGYNIANCYGKPNAALIAAAPMMLEALKEALTAFQLLGSGQRPSLSNAELVEIVGKAIAQAEGGR